MSLWVLKVKQMKPILESYYIKQSNIVKCRRRKGRTINSMNMQLQKKASNIQKALKEHTGRE